MKVSIEGKVSETDADVKIETDNINIIVEKDGTVYVMSGRRKIILRPSDSPDIIDIRAM